MAPLAGCNAILGIDPPNVIDDGARDGATVDTGLVADGSIGGGDVGDAAVGVDDGSSKADDGAPLIVNYLKNPSLENGCLSWDVNEATKTEDPTGRTGSSCRVCQVGTASVWSISQGFSAKDLKPGVHRLEAYLRRAQPSDASTFTVFASIHVNDGVSSTLIENSGEVRSSALDDTWQQHSVSLDYTIQDGGSHVEVAFIVRGEKGCFLLDDAAFYAKP